MTRRIAVASAVGLAGLAAVIGPLAAGSGADRDAHAAATSVGVTGTEYRFALSRSSASPGAVTFRFTNRGKLKHDFKIDGEQTPVIKPGKSASISVNLRAGSYKYLCTVKGHAAAGMKGTFRVR